jgi:hypothetical protein
MGLSGQQTPEHQPLLDAMLGKHFDTIIHVRADDTSII